jgi:hypothetical protein
VLLEDFERAFGGLPELQFIEHGPSVAREALWPGVAQRGSRISGNRGIFS